MTKLIYKFISLLLCFLLCLQQSSFAQVAVELNIAGHLSVLHNSLVTDKFRPVHLRYLAYDALSNKFNLLLDKGNLTSQATRHKSQLESETSNLMKYFFIGLTLPNESFWVNLRPDSPDNIIDKEVEQTDIGRIFLEADLQLKKDTSSATSPQTPEGKEYWDKLYKKAGELYGSENVTIPTLTRPWIVPGEIIIREAVDNGSQVTGHTSQVNPSAYIYKATLKVMLEEDYLNSQPVGDIFRQSYNEVKNRKVSPVTSSYSFPDERAKALNEYSTQLIRELIIPKLTKEVNSSKRYAPLRQVYYSLILAQWFKARATTEGDMFRQSVNEASNRKVSPVINLINSQNLTNLTSQQSWDKDNYFQAYKKSFAEGEYNIKEPVYTPTGQVIRSYMSGGMRLNITIPEPTSASPMVTNRDVTVLLGREAAGSPLNNYDIPVTVSSLGSQAVLDSAEGSSSPIQALSPKEESPHGEPVFHLIGRNLEGYAQTYNKIMEKVKDKSGFIDYDNDVSFGAQAAVKLKVLECLAQEHRRIIEAAKNDLPKLLGIPGPHRINLSSEEKDKLEKILEKSIQRMISPKTEEAIIKTAVELLYMLQEDSSRALLPVGTEVEVWKRRYPGGYNRDIAGQIWEGIFLEKRGNDGLYEFILPPSHSYLAQVAMINSLIELGLIPQGWFSFHISGGFPNEYIDSKLLGPLANYIELVKGILYTSENRLRQFARSPFGNVLAIKAGQYNVSEVNGKAPAFIVDKDGKDLFRIEYRSGDVVHPDGKFLQSLRFVQIMHSLMFLTILAAVSTDDINTLLKQRLVEVFDSFIASVNDWKDQLPDKDKTVANLFEEDLFKPNRNLSSIVGLSSSERQKLSEKINDLIVTAESIFENAEELLKQEADRDAVENLEIVRQLRGRIPKGKEREVFDFLTRDYLDTFMSQQIRRYLETPNIPFEARDFNRHIENRPLEFSFSRFLREQPKPTNFMVDPALQEDIFSVISPNFQVRRFDLNNQVIRDFAQFSNEPVDWNTLSINTFRMPFMMRFRLWLRRLFSRTPLESRIFEAALSRNEQAYRDISANTQDLLTRTTIWKNSIIDAANELGITPEELMRRLRVQGKTFDWMVEDLMNAQTQQQKTEGFDNPEQESAAGSAISAETKAKVTLWINTVKILKQKLETAAENWGQEEIKKLVFEIKDFINEKAISDNEDSNKEKAVFYSFNGGLDFYRAIDLMHPLTALMGRISLLEMKGNGLDERCQAIILEQLTLVERRLITISNIFNEVNIPVERDVNGKYRLPEDFVKTMLPPRGSESVASSVEETGKENLGGIDMRALPQHMKIERLSTSSSLDSGFRRNDGVEKNRGGLLGGQSLFPEDKELRELKDMIDIGMIPSLKRFEEILQSCSSSLLPAYIDQELSLLAERLRIEEDKNVPTENSLKEFIVVLESNKAPEELKLALSQIEIPEKEPELAPN